MTNVKTDTNAHPKTGESGATMVQAAIILPLFMAVLLGSIRILVISYQGIRLQHEVSETLRMTFTLDRASRQLDPGSSQGATWEDYFYTRLFRKSYGMGLVLGGKFGNGGGKNYNYKVINPVGTIEMFYTNLQGSTTSDWPRSDAKPGETFSITVKSQEPLFSTKLAGISSPTIELRAKAVAVINRAEDE